MRNFSILFFSLLAINFIACKSEVSKDITEFTINVKDSIQIALSEIADNVTYTKLETTPDILVGNLRKIIRKGDNIFTQATRGEVKRFSIDGKFINSVGSLGKGPGEYTSVGDIAVDEEYVYILSSNNTVVKYGFDGKYIDTYDLSKKIGKVEQEGAQFGGIWTFCFYCFKDEFFLNVGDVFVPSEQGGYNNYTKIIRTDKEFNMKDSTTILEYYIPEMAIHVFTNIDYFFTLNDKLYFWPASISPQTFINSSIYSYKDEKIEKEATFNFERYETTERGTSSLAVRLLSFTDRYFFADYYENIFYYDVSINKKQSAAGGFKDDFYNTGKVRLRPYKDNIYYFIKDGYELIDIIDGVEEESNPVIFWVELKKGEN